MSSRHLRFVGLLVVAALVQGCVARSRTAPGPSLPPAPPIAVAPTPPAAAPPSVLPFLVNVQPQFPGVQQGASVQLVATATDELGVTSFPQPPIAWTLQVTTSSGGTLTPSGVTAIYIAPNKFTVDPITAAAGAASGFAQAYTAGGSSPASLSVVPFGAQVFAGGGTQQLAANVVDASGIVLAPQPVTWSVQPNTLGSNIDPVSGLFTAGSSPGPFQVIASAAGGLQGSVTVMVVPYECQYPFCQAVPPGQASSVLWLCDGICHSGNCYKKDVATNQPQFCAANPATKATQPATALYTDLSINAWQPGDPDLFLCDDLCLLPGSCSGLGQVTLVQANCAGLSHKIELRPANRVPANFAGPATVPLVTCSGICPSASQCERNGTLVADPSLCVGGATPTGIQAVR